MFLFETTSVARSPNNLPCQSAQVTGDDEQLTVRCMGIARKCRLIGSGVCFIDRREPHSFGNREMAERPIGWRCILDVARKKNVIERRLITERHF